MAFHYDIESVDPVVLAISQVRLQLGDTDEGRGVRANGRNIQDAELQTILDGNSSDVLRAVGAACEMLSRDWSRVASISVGPRSQQFGLVAEQWAKRAAELGAKYGFTGGFAFSVAPNRVDGYSDNAAPAGYE